MQRYPEIFANEIQKYVDHTGRTVGVVRDANVEVSDADVVDVEAAIVQSKIQRNL